MRLEKVYKTMAGTHKYPYTQAGGVHIKYLY